MKSRKYHEELDAQHNNRTLYKFQHMSGLGIIPTSHTTNITQLVKKSSTKNFLPKRSQSITRPDFRIKKNDAPSDGMILNGTKLKAWLFGDESIQNIKTCPDEIQDSNVKYKNIDQLLKEDKPSKDIKTLVKQKTVLKFFKGKFTGEEPVRWQKLPDEFKKEPVFQAIFLKKKSQALQPMAQPDINQSFRPQFKETFYRAKQQEDRENSSYYPDETKFYAIGTIGYQNYKYQKITAAPQPVKERSTSLSKLSAAQRTTTEQSIFNEYYNNQKRVVTEVTDTSQITENLHLRRPKSLSQAFIMKTASSSVSMDKYEIRQLMVGEPVSGFELNNELDNDPNYLKKSVSRIPKTLKASPSPSPEKHKNPLFDNSPMFEGNKSPLFERKRSTKSFKGSAILSQSIVQDKGYPKEWKAEFDEGCNMSQKWIQDLQNQVLEEDIPEKELQEHLANAKNRSPGIYLDVFVETQPILAKHKRMVAERILIGLGIASLNKLTLVNWEQFCKYKKLLVEKSATKSEMIDFAIQMFKLKGKNEVEKEDFVRLIKNIVCRKENEIKLLEESSHPENILLENYKQLGIVQEGSQSVQLKKIREVYTSNKMNIIDLIDFIASTI